VAGERGLPVVVEVGANTCVSVIFREMHREGRGGLLRDCDKV
jgi:hypothetical protein